MVVVVTPALSSALSLAARTMHAQERIHDGLTRIGISLLFLITGRVLDQEDDSTVNCEQNCDSHQVAQSVTVILMTMTNVLTAPAVRFIQPTYCSTMLPFSCVPRKEARLSV